MVKENDKLEEELDKYKIKVDKASTKADTLFDDLNYLSTISKPGPALVSQT